MDKHSESKLLKLLRDAPETFVTGEELSRNLGISRSAIWKHVESLREAGYDIAAAHRLGYRFQSAPDLVLPDEIRQLSKTRVIGRQVLSFASIDSTNRLAMEM